MARIRRVESRSGKVLLGIGAYLLVALIATIVVGIANSNIFWGEANQYGRVPIPGKKVLQLPSGDVQVNVAAALPGRGNETPEMPLPTLTLAIIPAGGEQGEPEVENDLGYSTNANDNYVDTQRRVWKVHLPEAGPYLAIVKGDFTGYGVNAQAWFGEEPAPIHGGMIPLLGALIAAAIFAVGGVITLIRRGRKGDGPAIGPDGEAAEVDETTDAAGLHGVGAATSKAIERSQELERLHASGAISDAAYHDERAKIEADLKRESAR